MNNTMNNMMKKPEEMDVVELKALAYDISVQIAHLDNNLKFVNELIAGKSRNQGFTLPQVIKQVKEDSSDVQPEPAEPVEEVDKPE